jgi:hypothetical protein
LPCSHDFLGQLFGLTGIKANRNNHIFFAQKRSHIMKLATNMGQTDKIIRIALAVVFAALNLLGVVGGTLGLILWILAAVFVLTSVVSFCPLYLPFKFSTKGK